MPDMKVSVKMDGLEEISAAIILVEPNDLQEIARIHTLFEELASRNGSKEIAGLIAQCITLLEAVIFGEETFDNTVQKVSDNVSQIRRIASGDTESTDNWGDLTNDKSEWLADGGCDETEESQAAAFSTPPEGCGDSAGTADNSDNSQVSSPDLPSNVDEEIFTNFLSRQSGVLEEMECTILNIEKGAEISEFKRLIHTLKGEAGVLGLQDIERLCHRTEDYIEKFNGNSKIDNLLLVKDCFQSTFDSYTGKQGKQVAVEEVLKVLDDSITENESSQTKLDADFEIDLEQINADRTLLCDFITESDEHLHNADTCLLELENNSGDMEMINSLFRVFHTIKGIAGFLSLKAIQSLAHATEELLDMGRKGEMELSGGIIDIVFTSVDALKLEILSLRYALESKTPYKINQELSAIIDQIAAKTKNKNSEKKKIGELLIEDGKVSEDQVKQALKKQLENPGKKVGEILVESRAISETDIQDACSRQQGGKKNLAVKETIKVETEKLDRLIEAIGELVVTEAMVTGDQDIIRNVSSNTLKNIRQLDKITRQLQETGLSMRMVSMKSTFQKMARLVRDLSKKSGKQIDFMTSGEDTELDKSVIEKIGDPLVHMVRNSADHGIETSEEREKAGKSPSGTIHLRAFQTSGMICIEIEDDGKGLDKDAILEKALKQGLIKEGESLTDQEIFGLVFQPGFSTAKQVTDISGRGVGMDVVKKNVQGLRGNIEVKSEKGKGSVFSIYLPLTMAIMDGMAVTAGKNRYILPTLSVVESFRPDPKQLSTVVNRGEMVQFHDRLVPLVHLSNILSDEEKKDPASSIVMVVEDMGKLTGLVVDSIIGQQQTVIKKLGDGIGKVRGVSGGAIMPDGNISLIIDIGAVMKMV